MSIVRATCCSYCSSIESVEACTQIPAHPVARLAQLVMIE